MQAGTRRALTVLPWPGRPTPCLPLARVRGLLAALLGRAQQPGQRSHFPEDNAAQKSEVWSQDHGPGLSPALLQVGLRPCGPMPGRVKTADSLVSSQTQPGPKPAFPRGGCRPGGGAVGTGPPLSPLLPPELPADPAPPPSVAHCPRYPGPITAALARHCPLPPPGLCPRSSPCWATSPRPTDTCPNPPDHRGRSVPRSSSAG